MCCSPQPMPPPPRPATGGGTNFATNPAPGRTRRGRSTSSQAHSHMHTIGRGGTLPGACMHAHHRPQDPGDTQPDACMQGKPPPSGHRREGGHAARHMHACTALHTTTLKTRGIGGACSHSGGSRSTRFCTVGRLKGFTTVGKKEGLVGRVFSLVPVAVASNTLVNVGLGVRVHH